MKKHERLLNETLNDLERREAVLLGWGTVDGGYTYEELADAVEAFAEANGLERDDLLRDLFDRALVLPFHTRRGEIFRTRMAETVRLLARLRQLFPYHLQGGAPRWRNAPSLVSDYRFALRPQCYPRRHLALKAIRGIFEKADLRLSGIQQRTLETMVGEWELADFQVEAARQMLIDMKTSRRSRGLIVGAGTGTGKTLAFYLPALLRVVESVTEDKSNWVRVLALYPRNELLKDQLTSALGRVLKLNAALRHGVRALSLGAFYGDTPYRATEEALRWAKWRRMGDAYICPYFRDPDDGGDLVWHRRDLSRGEERLRRASDGSEVCGPDAVRLTRDRLTAERPDLLFTTTEMLNRNLGSAANGPLLGVRTDRPPEMVLLDEAHTYSSTHGAQVAYLLRRWRHAISKYGRPHFTGLSATLTEAVPFFAALTGLPEYTITSIRADHAGWPQDEAGHEYLVAMRGDPFSGASLLGTTIQATMLMRRALDPFGPQAPSGGLFGQRIFLFTDDLDVTNRLFDDVADAEGLWRRRGRPVPNPHKEPLAALRSPLNDLDEEARFEGGQSWRLVEPIGHEPSLVPRLHLDRVSSQDSGVAQNADIVVATASLEVGYDDDRVGAVMQHKAPRDVASFLQRKGRAGRPQRMRPWTCVVLSDYGRDRIAYQNYDALFDPVVKPQHLPLANRYVLRMQATYAVLEWIAERLLRGRGGGRFKYLDPWRALSQHGDGYLRRDQEAFLGLVRELVEQPEGEAVRSLQTHLAGALSVSDDEVAALLWEPPRALMTTALPTLLRRLESNWSLFRGGIEQESKQPLPEFIPPTLFSDLNLPEVTLELPPIQRGKETIEQEPQDMAVERTLRDYAPGRVSRRFGYEDEDIRHWVALPSWSQVSVRVPIDEFVQQADALGEYKYRDIGGGTLTVPVLRPIRLRLDHVPKEVLTASNARSRWHTQILPPPLEVLGLGQRHPVSERLGWRALVTEVRFYTHLARVPIEVRRFTTGSDATLLVRPHRAAPSEEHRIETWFDRNGEDIALGFTQTVDAVAFVIRMPDVVALRKTFDPAMERSQRTAYFRHSVLEAEGELPEVSVFQIDWLQQALLGAIVERGHEDNVGLPEAFRRLRAEGLGNAILSVLDRILEAQIDPDSGDTARGRHGERLAAFCHDDGFIDVLAEFAPLLWAVPDATFDAWLYERMRITMGAALLAACAELTPGRSEDGLLLDLDAGPGDSDDEEIVWISESTLGGNGLIEAVLQGYAQDPRRFFALAEQALQGSDLELVAHEVPRALHLLQTDAAQTAEAVREAHGLAETQAAHEELRRQLRDGGVLCTHSVYAALTHRLLRPGATARTVTLLAELLERWDALEAHCQVEVEPRVFAYLAAQDESLLPLYPSASVERQADPIWRAGVIYSLLWTRGGALRAAALQPYNPFVSFRPTDRALVLQALPKAGSVVTLGSDAWRKSLEDSLQKHGRAYLKTDAGNTEGLKEVLLSLTEQPMEVEFLHLHPHVEAVRRSSEGFLVSLVLSEALQ